MIKVPPGQLRLASYEYDGLQQRHHKLQLRHEELYKLCLAYRDVICGFSSSEEQSVSIDQLRAEAGRKGMRAKALEADVLKPIIREAGGLHALMSRMESMRPLIEIVGGPQGLEDLIPDLEEVGGSQGLHKLIGEAKMLREQQLGLAAKAAKYDKLVQTFNDMKALLEPTAPAETTTMNPARASLIASMPLENDPHRDLYEPPPVEKPRNKTGSNNIPLGPPRVREQPAIRLSTQPWLKREQIDDTREEMVSKRSRIELELDSAVM